MFDDFCACLNSHVLFCVGELPEAVEDFLRHLVRRRGGHDRHLGEGDGLQPNFKFITHARVFCFDQVALPPSRIPTKSIYNYTYFQSVS